MATQQQLVSRADFFFWELSEGGTFGRPTLFSTPTCQKLLDCKHSKAHNFKEEWEGGRYKLVCLCVKSALRKCTVRARIYCLSAFQPVVRMHTAPH